MTTPDFPPPPPPVAPPPAPEASPVAASVAPPPPAQPVGYAAAPAPLGTPVPLGTPAPVAPSAVAPSAVAPSAVGSAVTAWWALLRALFSGDLVRATDLAVGAARPAGARWAWAFGALVNGVLVGLALALLMSRVSDATYYFMPSGSDYVVAFLVPVLLSALLVLARAGAIWGLFRLRGRAIDFADAASLGGVAFALSTPFLVAALVLSLIPGSFAAVVLGVSAVFTTFYAEICVYVAVARAGRFEKSPALPHALASTAWVCVMTLLCWLVIRDVTADLFDAFGGVL